MEEEYIFGKIIGRGNFSVVRACTQKKTGRSFAAKIVEKGHLTAQNEIEILKQTNHANIVKLIDVLENKDKICMIMELVNGGELFEELISNGPFDETRAYYFFGQILDAIHHLHSKNIVHRDLKLQNILLSSESRIKVTDFGLSKWRKDQSETMETRCGTPVYTAPEVIQGELYDNRVDIWSLGIILYLLLFVKYPFMGEGIDELFAAMKKESISFEGPFISSEAKDLIQNLLQLDPQKRISLEHIYCHPWMKRFQLAPEAPDSIGKS